MTTATSIDCREPRAHVARAHCASRLLERYGSTRYVEAYRLYDRHSDLLEGGVGTELYECPDGSRTMRLHDRGETYYPVLRAGVIVTYLSGAMVRRNLKNPPPW